MKINRWGFALLFAFAAPVAAQTTPISAIQGSGDATPLLGQNVSVEGIVTADFRAPGQFSGFFLQDPTGDGDPVTSDAIFVFVSNRSHFATTVLKAGDRVKIDGKVAEHAGQTQLQTISRLEVVGHETVPAPTEISLPLPGGQTLERFEGMLVHFAQTLTVTDQHELPRYGTVALAAEGRLFVPTNQKPLSPGTPDEKMAGQSRVILLDDTSDAWSPNPLPYLDSDGTRRVGDTISGLTGILNFGADHFRLQPTIAPVFEAKNPRPLTAPGVGGNLKIAGANVHNYWTTFKNKQNPDARGADGPASFERQSAKIVAELKGLDADVLGLMELENNGTKAIDELVGRLNAAYGSQIYASVPIPITGLGYDKIRVAMIYKIARLTPRGPSQSATEGIFDRRPLAQTFEDKKSGGVFTVIVNHFKSKGSPPETGDVDMGEGAWTQKRTAQAKALLAFVQKLRLTSHDADVFAIGDFNAYIEETPLRTLREGGLKHLNLRLPVEERYSYGYDGQYGSLDHALATPEAEKQVTGFAEWHINADEPFFLAPEIQRVRDFKRTPFRASDHDPFLVGLNLKSDKVLAPPSVMPKPVVKPTPKPVLKPTPKPVKPKTAPKKPIQHKKP